MNDDSMCCGVRAAVTMGYTHGLCSCFGNCRVCIITYLVPCYTAGKVAEAVGKNCAMFGVLFVIAPVGIILQGCIVRPEVRKSKGIDGKPAVDCLLYCFCPCCALIQDARETGALGSTDMARGAEPMQRA